MGKPDDETLSAAECALRTGLTVRALRVYEREGLLRPARSANGWRRYGPADLTRLNTIVILKALGLTLAQIRDLVAEDAPSLLRVLEVQAESWKTKRAATERALALIEGAHRRLQMRQELSVSELCDLIKSLETERSSPVNASAPAMKDLIAELISPDEEYAWGSWWQQHPADMVQNATYLAGLNDMLSQMQRLLDRGILPTSPEAQALLAEHNAVLLRCGVRERAVRMMDWNSAVTAKWMGLGVAARERHLQTDRFPLPIGSRAVSIFLREAIAASVWVKSLGEILSDVTALRESQTDPGSPEIDEVIRRLRELCEAHSLGDAYVYSRWTPFMARVHHVSLPPGSEESWHFLERALLERGGNLASTPIADSQPAPMSRPEAELKIIRQAYAKQITAAAGVSDARISEAFASVPREKFLGAGPWLVFKVLGWKSIATPDADPVYVYTDDPVTLIRGINSGQPSFQARLLAECMPLEGAHVVHIGAGGGYYTAILAQLVGESGQVTAIECQPDLAARARLNLADRANVSLIEGDGTRVDFESADVIYVSAGATHFVDRWLDRLADGGTLILPLTPNKGAGAVFRIQRHGDDYFANWISPVFIYPCAGARDCRFRAGPGHGVMRWPGKACDATSVGTIGRALEQCWLFGPDWCLAYS